MTFTVKGIKETLKEIEIKKNEEIKSQKNKKLKNLVRKLKEVTPVDTGKARNGWYSDGDKIYNDVEYISHLNSGSSQQEPAFFIERTLLQEPGVKANGVIVRKKD